jgi:hypothetical protein
MGAGPADSTQTSIAAYLTAETYKQAPWISQTTAPRDDNSMGVSPHGKVRVWWNDTLVASQHAHNGTIGGTPHTTGSMAVKEMYDANDMRIGRAAMLKTPGGSTKWVYFCDSTDVARCTGDATLTVPHYGDDTSAVDCSGCHGGNIYNVAP